MASIATTISCNDRMSSALDKIVNSLEKMQSTLNTTNSTIEQFCEKQDKVSGANKTNADSFGSLIKKVTGYASALFSVQTAFNALKTGINYASDLAEVQNVVDVTFANSSEQVNEWSQNTLRAYGLNEVSAKNYVGTMGAMLKSSGLTEDQALSMSEAMTALAGDMASFYNLDIGTSFEKIRSGISGETEPLKQLGINMSVANLEAYALAQGIETSYSSMTQAEQAVLRYNYLLDATSDAQGDFSRTQDSWANQTKLLSENWQEFLGTATEGIMTALTPAVEGLNNLITNISENWDGFSTVLGVFAGAVGVAAAAILAWNIYQKLLNVDLVAFNATLWANPITWVVAGFLSFIAIVAIAVKAINGFCGTNYSAMGVIVGIFNTAVAVVWNLFSSIFNFLADRVVDAHNMLASLGNFLGNFLRNPLQAAAGLLADFVDTALSILQSLASTIDTIFGSNLASSVSGWRDNVTQWAADKFGTDQNKEYFEKWSSEDFHLNRKSYSGSWSNGYSAGASLSDAFSNLGTDDSTYDPSSVYNAGTWNADTISGIDDTETGENTSAIASNTSKSADSLKWLRELAEQEHIDKYTTAEVVVNFTSNANVTSTQDADSVFSEFSAKLQEAMMKSRAG